ncbi:MAG: hypothetical protein P4L69_24425 [Desulfosporosinus sp.]|nr:hypothetical protein [Desulfosporosinus sp.]
MPNRFEWSEIVIVGLVGGVASGCIAAAIRLGATTDNLLNFCGGAVGSGLAVTATLWLDARRRARALEHMLDSMVIMASVAMRFKSIDRKLTHSLILVFQQSAEAFEASRLGVSIQDPLHQYGFQSAYFWFKRAMTEIEGGLKLHDDAADCNELYEMSKKSALSIIGSIDDFLKMPGLPKKALRNFRSHKEIMDLSYEGSDLVKPSA